jgi:succinoglycan biosynthesis transport protein ExoP
MLQTPKPAIATTAETREHGSASEFYSSLLKFVYRQMPVIASVTVLALVLGAIYVLNTPASYTAQATMIIDTHKLNIFQQNSIVGDLPIDSASVESQVEILRSENIALAVIKELRLTSDPEFVGPGGGLVGNLVAQITDWLGGGGPDSQFELQRRATERFADRLRVKRVGLSYILDIRFRARNPERAAQIANAVADAYITDQLEAKYKATQRASVWLQDRIRELREQSSTAERAVVAFKSKHNIVDSGGKLMNEQQLSELNSQLVLAQAHTAETRARLDRIQQIVKMEVPDATVTDTLKNDVITKLRQQYLELKAREADWSARYGSNHLAAVNLRNQMFQLRQSILDELGRIAETYKSDYEIAKQREAAIQKGVSQAISESQTTNEAQVTLHELESTAQSYKSLYDNFLQRYMESVQQQTFPITEARVITAATPPLSKSDPKPLLILSLAGALGIALGLGVARLRDLTDRVFRTTAQVQSILNTSCIGIVPVLGGGKPAGRKASPPPQASVPIPAGGRIIARNGDIFWNVVDSPFSRSAESIRAIKVAADLSAGDKATKVVGVTSALPNEGKSTIAACLAEVMAQGGSRVILVDADLRNPSLTRRLAPQADAGLLEFLAGSAALADIVWTDPSTGLKFIPTVLKDQISRTHEIFRLAATKAFIQRLRSEYDYVIVDFSPLAPVVDVRTATHLVDSFVFVIEWGRTKIDAVELALQDARGVYENLIGVVLNKANIDVLNRYENYRGSYYYNKYYARYGYTD